MRAAPGPPPMLAAMLAAALVLVGALLVLGTGTVVSEGLDIGRGTALLALGASLVGSFVNVPVARVRGAAPPLPVEIRVFGVRYVLRPVTAPHVTVIAVNVGGAVLPVAYAAVLLARADEWGPAVAAIGIVTLVAFLAARPVQGVGIVLPTLVAPVAAAVAALALASPDAAPAVAYAAGTLGALVGADLLHLRRIADLGASVAAIGGAGTFDGIFVSGLVAVLLASL